MPDISKYIEDYHKFGYPREKIVHELRKLGYQYDEIEKSIDLVEKKHKKHHTVEIVAMLILLAAIGSGAYVYLTYISPANVAKPELTAPLLMENATPEEVVIEEEHVEYIVNEVDGYKLHDDPRNNEPAVIEFVLIDGEVFTVEIVDNMPKAREGAAEHADIRIRTDRMMMLALLKSSDFKSEAVTLAREGKIAIELLSDEATLALKGYKAVYDSMNGE